MGWLVAHIGLIALMAGFIAWGIWDTIRRNNKNRR